jgi:2-amino-4-hydroxy-6-hydroxymethyldihydropteridine diphosphokinase
MSSRPTETSKIKSEAFIAVGSNIEPQQNISRALSMLAEYVTISAISNFYRSAALERADQDDFINGVVKISTTYQPQELKFNVLRKIESQLGRIRTNDKHAARTIDLDLILYDDMIMNEVELVLPDPGIYIYPFIALPLLELAPGIILPGTRTQLSGIKAALKIDTMRSQREFTDKLKSHFPGKV